MVVKTKGCVTRSRKQKMDPIQSLVRSYMCQKNGDHASATYDVQSVADMVMVISERDHKINTNLHTNIKLMIFLTLFSRPIISSWFGAISSLPSFIIFAVTTWYNFNDCSKVLEWLEHIIFMSTSRLFSSHMPCNMLLLHICRNRKKWIVRTFKWLGTWHITQWKYVQLGTTQEQELCLPDNSWFGWNIIVHRVL